ncbi:glycosyltransferase, partial [bacterium]|nr:glycosyltransferase [candidate division CSSED10-310 bacterium]
VFYKIQKKLPARLVLVGKGPDLGIAQELCSELELCNKITFAGSQPNIETYYRNSHLFLLLSDYESFGLSALEAMACGTPVAVTNAGGLPEVVNDNETGLLLDISDLNATSDRIINLLTDPQKWQLMSKLASKYAQEYFEVSKVVPLYEKLYESIR